jgi:uncharacterized protein (DUF433 family)
MTASNVTGINHIVIDRRAAGGRATVRDTGITVAQVLTEVSRELEPSEILRTIPQLTVQDIQAVLEFASRALSPDQQKPAERLIEDLGWSAAEAAETRERLQAFAEDWDDPAMDVYDAPLSQ